jgi:hypothetical protein
MACAVELHVDRESGGDIVGIRKVDEASGRDIGGGDGDRNASSMCSGSQDGRKPDARVVRSMCQVGRLSGALVEVEYSQNKMLQVAQRCCLNAAGSFACMQGLAGSWVTETCSQSRMLRLPNSAPRRPSVVEVRRTALHSTL